MHGDSDGAGFCTILSAGWTDAHADTPAPTTDELVFAIVDMMHEIIYYIEGLAAPRMSWRVEHQRGKIVLGRMPY